MTNIWWIRRDLRLRDNQALTSALAKGDQVVPVFIIDPILVGAGNSSEKRLAFLWSGLRSLEKQIEDRGGRLIVRKGAPVEQLKLLMQESNASEIFSEQDFTPYARRRDENVQRLLPLKLLSGLTYSHPKQITKRDGTPYQVYTPYKRAWKRQPLPTSADVLPAPEHLSTPLDLGSESIPSSPRLSSQVQFISGESVAQQRLRAFISGEDPPIYRYALARNLPDVDGTSGLSPYLRFGMLSARQAIVAALAAKLDAQVQSEAEGAEAWLNELIWREFFVAILYHFPDVLATGFRPNLREIKWRNDQIEFQAWKDGQTGYPIVDAAMRQLLQTGWMHNRSRMIVASFLTKDLLIDWRWGQRWFMQNLIDGDLAANNGGWQWVAGTGTDASPYFRIFNPITQGKKFDPAGTYIRRWVPALENVPEGYIHTPWEMPEQEQKEVGCVIGLDYPPPIVEHRWARQVAPGTYRQARESKIISQ